MNKNRIIFLGIVLFIGLMLTGCAGYYSGYGYYESPYYNYDYGYYPYRHHREFGVFLSGANIVGLASITGEMNITPTEIKTDMLILERPSKQRNQNSIVKKREKNLII